MENSLHGYLNERNVIEMKGLFLEDNRTFKPLEPINNPYILSEGYINLLSESGGKKKKVWVVLINGDGFISRQIKKFSKGRFCHAAISLDPTLTKCYSFNFDFVRDKMKISFVNGLFEENFHTFYGQDSYYSLYSMEVDELTYRRLENSLNYFINRKNELKYNFEGIIRYLLGKPVEKQDKMFCSEFVAHVFQMSGINIFNKPLGLIAPGDFAKTKMLKFERRGKVKNFNKKGRIK